MNKDYFNIISVAYQSLKKHKVRTALTVLGIVIGIAAVIIVIAAGEGVKGYIANEISNFGENIIQVEVKAPNTGKTSTQNVAALTQGLSITTLTIDDAKAVAKLPYVEDFTVGLQDQEIIKYQNVAKTSMIFGADEYFIDLFGMNIDKGNYFTNSDVETQARVVVLGPKLKETLFGIDDAIGKRVKIRNLNFRVIGVTEERGLYFTMDLDNVALVPVKTLQKQLMGIDYIQYFIARLEDKQYIERGVLDVSEILRQRHNFTERDPDKYDFSVNTMQEISSMIDSIMGGVTLLLLAIAAISLIVGGVGIMNIMYVSVSERTYEIGLRKAVGASRKDILKQFLYEACFLTFGGALVGVIIGILWSALIAYIANLQNFAWQFSIPVGGVIMAVVISVAIGIVFGYYPARKAANLDPITALRR